MDFNPRAPCGARLLYPRGFSLLPLFQPTRPLRGATIRRSSSYLRPYKFQPTRPLRGATETFRRYIAEIPHFNPRAPCGARPFGHGQAQPEGKISTHAPLAGRDKLSNTPFQGGYISTHAPLAGRDSVSQGRCPPSHNFNPRAPCGARPLGCGYRMGSLGFQPTRPLRGATI